MSGIEQMTLSYLKGFRVHLQNVASTLGLWIVARQTNEEAFQYLSQTHKYVPKPPFCKAKSGNRNVKGYKLAGLIPSPFVHPEAFTRKLEDAIKYWNKVDPTGMGRPENLHPERRFGSALERDAVARDQARREGAGKLGRDSGIGIVSSPEHPHYGCLRFNGKVICGDCDLADIIDPRRPLLMERELQDPSQNPAAFRHLHGALNISGPLVEQVARAVNSRAGTNVIQHGPHFYFAEADDEYFEVYPAEPRERCLILYGQGGLREFYESRGWAERLQMHKEEV